MIEWQPIETAPEEETVLVLISVLDRFGNEPGVYVHSGVLDGEGWWLSHDGPLNLESCEPTHWMPLPNLPIPANQKTSDTDK
jgi:hypothetical protein